MTVLKPWREIAVPHEDVLKGTFQQAEFAADLSRVHDHGATKEYQDPALFFQRTFITEGMRLLLNSVVKRLVGRGGDPVIQLQTAFGGGKTHTMLAVYHLAKGEAPVSDLSDIPPILDSAGVTELPKAQVVVLDGNKIAPHMPQKRGRITVHTLWGELAWQLGKEEAYARIKEADESGTSPGKEVLTQLLTAYAPCVILMDELVAYIRQFESGKSFAGGTYDSNLSFIQALTEALKAVPNAVLLASLPESDKEAGSQRGISALRTLEHYFARVQAIWKPVATEEAFEIVRRRLFTTLNDVRTATAVCRAYADFYLANSADVPQETQESRYYDRLLHAYPIHPEVFDRLYEDWSTLDNFQRTRGVLKLMAKVIYRLWKDGNNDVLITPGSLPLYDSDTRNEAIYYLPQGWDPVLERDIDGEQAETAEIESRDTRFGAVQACRRAARTIFLGSAPTTTNQFARGLEIERIILGCAQPGHHTSVFKDSLRRLTDRLHYLNSANNRFWFDTRPNLRREMEERKRRFQDKDDVFPAIRERLEKSVTSGVFAGAHVFRSSGDVPDDGSLRLVVLPPDAPFSRQEERLWRPTVDSLLKQRGEQPRQKQNRLIFLAAEYDSVERLKDQVRSMLAWQSIVSDYRENRIVLDNLMAKNAEAALSQARDGLQRMIRETYKWILAPMQEAIPSKGVSDLRWEYVAISPSAPNLSQEIEKVLKENELLILDWAPIHLRNLLQAWYWKDGVEAVAALSVWQDSTRYLYLPRLKTEDVFRNACSAGAASEDFFGVAFGKEEGRYLGFSFGKPTLTIFDETLLLIEPKAAAAFAKSVAEEKTRQAQEERSTDTPATPEEKPVVKEPQATGLGKVSKAKKRFYATIGLDPLKAKIDFSQIVDEVIQHFATKHDVQVKIAIEIQAESPSGFDADTQRTVRENCTVLKFKQAEFEES